MSGQGLDIPPGTAVPVPEFRRQRIENDAIKGHPKGPVAEGDQVAGLFRHQRHAEGKVLFADGVGIAAVGELPGAMIRQSI